MQGTQSSFIRGRNAFNGWIVTSEVMDAMKRSGDGMTFKIDFEKTYNCVD